LLGDSEFVMINLFRHQTFAHIGRRALYSKFEVQNCRAKFQNHLHLSACSATGEFRDLLTKPEHKPKLNSKFPGFEPIFISPHIRTIKFVCRLKLYTTGVILACLPVSFHLLNSDQILPSQVGVSAGFAAGTLVVLGLVGEYFRKFVGILYLSEDRTQVIISHNSFFGKRKDVTIDVNDIVPLADSPETVDDLVWKIRLYSGDPKSYYICTRFGGISSRKGFREIFGEDQLSRKLK